MLLYSQIFVSKPKLLLQMIGSTGIMTWDNGRGKGKKEMGRVGKGKGKGRQTAK